VQFNSKIKTTKAVHWGLTQTKIMTRIISLSLRQLVEPESIILIINSVAVSRVSGYSPSIRRNTYS